EGPEVPQAASTAVAGTPTAARLRNVRRFVALSTLISVLPVPGGWPQHIDHQGWVEAWTAGTAFHSSFSQFGENLRNDRAARNLDFAKFACQAPRALHLPTLPSPPVGYAARRF